MLYLLSLFSLLLTGPAPILSPKKANLLVEIQNVQPLKGAIYIALFKSGQDFPEGKPIEGKKLEATSRNVQASFSLEPGDYAIAVFHDENGNGKLDKRVFGIPKEPYGFSNNFRPRLSAPKFSDCQFSVGTGEKTIRIEVK